MLPKRKLKQARMILISAISFTIGGYLLWVAFSVFWTFSVEKGFNHSHIDHVNL